MRAALLTSSKALSSFDSRLMARVGLAGPGLVRARAARAPGSGSALAMARALMEPFGVW